jgi:hypothetical protein
LIGDAAVVAFAADVAAHASLTHLTVQQAFFTHAAALDAVVDAALARRLQSTHFHCCYLETTSAPALARLLGGDALMTLELHGMSLDLPAARVLAAALRATPRSRRWICSREACLTMSRLRLSCWAR